MTVRIICRLPYRFHTIALSLGRLITLKPSVCLNNLVPKNHRLLHAVLDLSDLHDLRRVGGVSSLRCNSAPSCRALPFCTMFDPLRHGLIVLLFPLALVVATTV